MVIPGQLTSLLRALAATLITVWDGILYSKIEPGGAAIRHQSMDEQRDQPVHLNHALSFSVSDFRSGHTVPEPTVRIRGSSWHRWCNGPESNVGENDPHSERGFPGSENPHFGGLECNAPFRQLHLTGTGGSVSLASAIMFLAPEKPCFRHPGSRVSGKGGLDCRFPEPSFLVIEEIDRFASCRQDCFRPLP